MAQIITSPHNPKVKEAQKLMKSKVRKESGLILIEGKREINLALAGGMEINTLFYCPDCGYDLDSLDEKIGRDRIFDIAPAVFEKLSLRQNPDGFLAIAEAKKLSLNSVKLGKTPLVIILESVEKPGNLGAILRTADAAGVDAVIITDPKTDIFNPNTIRASQGTAFTVQTASASSEEVLKWAKTNKLKLFAATPSSSQDYLQKNFTGPTAILMGTEDAGLSPFWLEAADERIKIEMQGKIDSLNVSVSTAVVVFEAVRQRRKVRSKKLEVSRN